MSYDAEAFKGDLLAELSRIQAMLEEKNAAYGDSALNPVRIFSKASADEQLLVRIDDKLSRLARGHAAGEDVIADLLGYLVLYRIAQVRKGSTPITMAPGMHLKTEFTPDPNWRGPLHGKRVENVLLEQEGTVQDLGETILVDFPDRRLEYDFELFKTGLKQKWLRWVEEEQQDEKEA